MAGSKGQRISVSEGVEKLEPHALLVGTEIGAALRKTIRRFLKTLKIELAWDVAIPLLGINPK